MVNFSLSRCVPLTQSTSPSSTTVAVISSQSRPLATALHLSLFLFLFFWFFPFSCVWLSGCFKLLRVILLQDKTAYSQWHWDAASRREIAGAQWGSFDLIYNFKKITPKNPKKFLSSWWWEENRKMLFILSCTDAWNDTYFLTSDKKLTCGARLSLLGKKTSCFVLRTNLCLILERHFCCCYIPGRKDLV